MILSMSYLSGRSLKADSHSRESSKSFLRRYRVISPVIESFCGNEEDSECILSKEDVHFICHFLPLQLDHVS